jgi:SpoVK/Ycf46/Vps4 family AAA+-type ATPase
MVKDKKLENTSKIDVHEKALPDLVIAALSNDLTAIQSLSVKIARSLSEKDPIVSSKIISIVSDFSISRNPLRGTGTHPVPTDMETQLEIANVSTPNKALDRKPILSKEVNNQVSVFLQEWAQRSLLLERGLNPSTNILLVGKPGTGKTMLAKHLANQLELNLVTLDLSVSMSSLLGKTGQNLRKVFQYVRQNPCVLLLDEFDAIAKRRDDVSDLGEIKRIVNVLLMELDNLPITSVVVATSNHPELLDPAVWRRFDRVINIDIPGQDERQQLLVNGLLPISDLQSSSTSKIIDVVVEVMNGQSASALCQFSDRVNRRVILQQVDLDKVLVEELGNYIDNKKTKGLICKELKDVMGDRITVRQLSDITGLSPAGVQHHLAK